MPGMIFGGGQVRTYIPTLSPGPPYLPLSLATRSASSGSTNHPWWVFTPRKVRCSSLFIVPCLLMPMIRPASAGVNQVSNSFSVTKSAPILNFIEK
jgi:hypothetical protein